jgi:hypothetical protein
MQSRGVQQIQGYSYEERQDLLPALVNAVTDCGGWVLNRKTVSSTTLEFQVEVELRSIIDLYAGLIAAGMEMTRSGHLALTELCTCRRHHRGAELGQIVEMRLEISFLEEVTLHSLLMTSSALA